MSEEVAINKEDIGHFVNFVANFWVLQAENEKLKVKDMISSLESSMALGFILSRKNPDLAEACTQWWNYTHEHKADEFSDSMLSIYKSFRQQTREKK